MKSANQDDLGPESAAAIATAAAEWVMRLDRGLSPAEQDDYLHWLAADPRHGEAIARQRRTWEAFDRLAGLQSSVEAVPDPDLLNPENVNPPCGRGGLTPQRPGAASALEEVNSRRQVWFWGAALAAAAAVALIVWPDAPAVFSPPSTASSRLTDSFRLPPIEERILDDGTTIRLNRGAAVAVEFSPGERRVRLERGEAAFAVVKDAARPFVVVAAGVAVRAVGTNFNVRHEDAAVDVIVTEGSVAVARHGSQVPATSEPLVAAGQRVVVPLDSAAEPPQVSTLPAEEVARRLAWQPRLLTFSDEPLAVILNEFNRHNPVMLRLDDSALQELRLSARFRSDNVPGFLRLLELEFGVRAYALPNGDFALRLRR